MCLFAWSQFYQALCCLQVDLFGVVIFAFQACCISFYCSSLLESFEPLPNYRKKSNKDGLRIASHKSHVWICCWGGEY